MTRTQKFGVRARAIFYALRKMKITRIKRAEVSREQGRGEA
ncbi:IS630 transposase-related protein [Trichothermofontia sichuanensis]